MFAIIINQLIIKKNNEESINELPRSNEQSVSQKETKIQLNTNNEIVEKHNELENISKDVWQIEIEKIELIAPISEGTTKDVLDANVGHFEETSRKNGNIGLAAHNRGYTVNYFQNLKELEIGDTITYNYYGNVKKYAINIITIIKDTDWSYLQETKDNKITLITCVENMPELRRCIQATEIINN